MIVKVKVKQRPEQKGEEYEFTGEDAIDQAMLTLSEKYGVKNHHISVLPY